MSIIKKIKNVLKIFEFSKNSKYKEIIYFINLVLKNMHI